MFKIAQLADDTTLFLKDTRSLQVALKTIQIFSKYSGLRLNKDKSEIYQLGNCGQTNNMPEVCGIQFAKDHFKTLGIFFSRNETQMIEMNYEKILMKMNKTLNLWSARTLTLKGKVTVLKSLVIPQLLHVCTNMFTPDAFIMQAEKAIYRFLWSGKPSKIKKETIIADYPDGGLKMVDLRSVIASSKIMWIKRLFDEREIKWKKLIQLMLGKTEFELQCKMNIENKVTAFNSFYEQVLFHWYSFHSKEPKSGEQAVEEIIWNNRFILIGNKMVFSSYKDWYRKGIVRIKDIINETNNFLSLELLKVKFNVKCNTLEYESVLHAIPEKWKEMMKKVARGKTNFGGKVSSDPCTGCGIQTICIKNLSNKKIYWCLVNEIIKQPIAIDKWLSQFVFLLDRDFKVYFALTGLITKNSRLQMLQYKILHRIFPCNIYLFTLGLKDTLMCKHCKVPDTLEHYFFSCDSCKLFWKMLMDWIHLNIGIKIPLRKVDILFGIPFKICQDTTLLCVNFLILLAKNYIYTCKLNEESIFFLNYLMYLKSYLTVEEEITITRDNPDLFKRWILIFENL